MYKKYLFLALVLSSALISPSQAHSKKSTISKRYKKKGSSKVFIPVKAFIGGTFILTILVISAITVHKSCFSTEDTSNQEKDIKNSLKISNDHEKTLLPKPMNEETNDSRYTYSQKESAIFSNKNISSSQNSTKTEDTSETKDKANLIVPDRRVVKESQRFHDWVLSIDKGKVMISDIESDQTMRFETYLGRKNNRVQDISKDINIARIVLEALDPNTGQVAIVTTSNTIDNNTIWVLNFEEKRLEKLWSTPESINKITYDPKGYKLIVATKREIFSIPTKEMSEVKKTIYETAEGTYYNKFLGVLGCDGQYIYYGKISGPSFQNSKKVLNTVSMSDNTVKPIPLPKPIQEQIELEESNKYLSLEPQISPYGRYVAWLETDAQNRKEEKQLLCIMSRENDWALVKNNFSEKVPISHIIRYPAEKEHFKFNLNPAHPNDLSLLIQATPKGQYYADRIYLISLADKSNPQTKIIYLEGDLLQKFRHTSLSSNGKDLLYVVSSGYKDHIRKKTLGNGEAITLEKLSKSTKITNKFSRILPICQENI